ncbi:MAG: hypothetical protein ACRCZF_06655 [Gemmataceae bacterium]
MRSGLLTSALVLVATPVLHAQTAPPAIVAPANLIVIPSEAAIPPTQATRGTSLPASAFPICIRTIIVEMPGTAFTRFRLAATTMDAAYEEVQARQTAKELILRGNPTIVTKIGEIGSYHLGYMEVNGVGSNQTRQFHTDRLLRFLPVCRGSNLDLTLDVESSKNTTLLLTGKNEVSTTVSMQPGQFQVIPAGVREAIGNNGKPERKQVVVIAAAEAMRTAPPANPLAFSQRLTVWHTPQFPYLNFKFEDRLPAIPPVPKKVAKLDSETVVQTAAREVAPAAREQKLAELSVEVVELSQSQWKALREVEFPKATGNLVVLNSTAAIQLDRKLRLDKSMTVQTAPMIRTPMGQTASVEVGERKSYTMGLHMLSNSSSGVSVQPENFNCFLGLQLGCTASMENDGNIMVKLENTYSHIDPQSVRATRIPLPPNSDVLDKPSKEVSIYPVCYNSIKLSTTILLQNGETVVQELMTHGGTNKDDRISLLFFRVNTISQKKSTK